MVSLASLAIPIVVSAVLVFVASSIIHMLLPYHKSDFRKLPREDAVLEALRGLEIPPGDYVAPRADSLEGMKEPAFVEKMKRGPGLVMTVAAGGSASMGTSLLLWFLYSLLVGLLAADLASAALGHGAPYRAVFRIVGSAAFLGYSVALLQQSIWYRRNWLTTMKSVLDGLVYALLTAGTFGWLWPRS
jgi:hypothetical protein